MQVYRTPLLTLDPDAKAGGGLVEVVTLADAQAMVEVLQAQVKQLDRTLADVYAQRDGLQTDAWHKESYIELLHHNTNTLQATIDKLRRELMASKAENSRLMGVAEQQRELRESGEVYLGDVKAQLGQVQRERDELQVQLRLSRFNQANAEAAQNGLQAKIRALTQQLDAEREKVKAEQAQWEIQAREGGRLQDQLTQLQALVRALPVCIPASLKIFDASDGNGFNVHGAIKEPYSVGWIGTFLRRTEAESYIAVLKARATLDATTPAPRQKQVHSCEIPGCVSCANPEGGDGE